MRNPFNFEPELFEAYSEFDEYEEQLDGDLEFEVPSPSSTSLSAKPRVLTYSTKDVINKRISVPAQHSLVRLSKNPVTSADAVGMLEEVKAGRLAGIYCVNWEKPAKRALRFGKSWWTIIPQGEDAVLMLDPDNTLSGQPLIAFRRELDPRDKDGCGKLKTDKTLTPSPARLDAALLKAWASYWQRINHEKLHQLVYHPTLGYAWLLSPGAQLGELSTTKIQSSEIYDREVEQQVSAQADNRRLVSDTRLVPFRWICQLRLFFGNVIGIGTGTLITDRHILTAAHNLITSKLGTITRVTVVPGQNGLVNPMVFSDELSPKFCVSKEWRMQEKAEADFALLTLSKPIGSFPLPELGNRSLGYWGKPGFGKDIRIASAKPNDLRNRAVHTAGYPTDKCLTEPQSGSATADELRACSVNFNTREVIGSTQWRSFALVTDPSPTTEPGFIVTKHSHFPGQSGSPVWLLSKKSIKLVAILTGGFPDPTNPRVIVGARCVRISDKIFNQFNTWIRRGCP